MLRQHRSTQRKAPRTRDNEAALTADIVELAKRYGRYGYRRITALLRGSGWSVNHKRVERIWRREGLKVPAKQPRRGRLWLADGSCIRLRPERPGHVWAYDFVEDRTHDGRKFRILTVIDEYTRECLALPVGRQLRSDDVLAMLTDLFIAHGPPEHIRSDQGSEFIANVVKDWLGRIGVRTLYIEKASPWENGYNESFNGKLRDELLNGEIFYTLAEARVLIEACPDRNTHDGSWRSSPQPASPPVLRIIGGQNEPLRQRGPFWMPITPKTGSLLHAETQRRGLEPAHQVSAKACQRGTPERARASDGTEPDLVDGLRF